MSHLASPIRFRVVTGVERCYHFRPEANHCVQPLHWLSFPVHVFQRHMNPGPLSQPNLKTCIFQKGDFQSEFSKLTRGCLRQRSASFAEKHWKTMDCSHADIK